MSSRLSDIGGWTIAASIASAGSLAQTTVVSQFNASNENWSIAAMNDFGPGAPDRAVQITPAQWVSGPGSGHLRNDFQPSGTTMYWSAPGPYCGHKL